MIKPILLLLFVAMEDLAVYKEIPFHVIAESMEYFALLNAGNVPTFSQMVYAFDNDYGLNLLSRCIYLNITRPVKLLKDVAANVRRLWNLTTSRGKSRFNEEEEAETFPFKSDLRFEECLTSQLSSCRAYFRTIDFELYGGVFACSKIRDKHRHRSSSSICGKDRSNSCVITDVELLCVFVAIVSLRSMRRESEEVERNLDAILQALREMKDIYGAQWNDWPFTAAPGGNEERDERSFDALFGSDSTEGRQNKWQGIFRAFSNTVIFRGDNSRFTRVYVGRPVIDLFELVPLDVHGVLFGEKLASVLILCYNYSVKNMPFLLGSDTNPVIAEEFPAIVPSGCRERESTALFSTNAMTLVTRHAIPSSRRLGSYLLKRDGICCEIGKAVAECMVDYSIREEGAVITCPDSEIRCVEKHVQMLLSHQGRSENCGMCDRPLDLDPHFHDEGGNAFYNFFRMHAFMDTFEAVDKTCSASLCPDCVIHLVHFVYEKITTHSGVALNEAFKCPCCNEYLINWLGRCHEFSNMCRGHIKTPTESLLKEELIKRMESCFTTLEILQSDFMETGSPLFDFLPSEKSRFYVVNQRLRPPVKRYKLTEGTNSRSRCALTCARCVTPLSCDRPDEQMDIETIDVAPPSTPYLTDPYELDVEDAVYDDDLTDEIIKYDNGPGTHKWPTRLSCGFIASNSNSAREVITTCNEAVAVLGRVPKKKIRGWNKESPEGKAIIALANWQRSGTPPSDMFKLLIKVPVTYRKNDCLCIKAASYPFSDERALFEETEVARIPLVTEFFKEKSSKAEFEENLLKYADLFTRNLVSESLLQMHECVYHRASGFVLKHGKRTIKPGLRPDDAAKLEYVIDLNNQRKSWFSVTPSYTPREDRTIEWFVEKGGQHIKIVTCFNCGTAAIKEGGCVAMTCDECQSSYCWLCEKPLDIHNHVILEHGLLYCDSESTKREMEAFYNLEIATMQFHVIKKKRKMTGEDDEMEVYVMEDGYTFDVDKNRAVKMMEC